MNDQLFITTKKDLKTALKEVLEENNLSSKTGSFIIEKLSLSQAAEFAGMSIPTFHRRVKLNHFKKHGSGRKVFFLKSEIEESLINS